MSSRSLVDEDEDEDDKIFRHILLEIVVSGGVLEIEETTKQGLRHSDEPGRTVRAIASELTDYRRIAFSRKTRVNYLEMKGLGLHS